MDIAENIREGIRSVQANLLRSILTALIVAIGITSLVGILTAIDGIKASITDSFSNLGVNSFEIRSKDTNRGSREGVKEKVYEPLKFKQTERFQNIYKVPANVSVSTFITSVAEAKRKSIEIKEQAKKDAESETQIFIKRAEKLKKKILASAEQKISGAVDLILKEILS